MNTNRLLLFLLLIMSNWVFSQEPRDTITIGEEYSRSKKAPLMVVEGTVILNKADKLYLVNDIRYNYYEELRELVKDNVDKDVEDIVLKYEKILKENDVLFESLEAKCKEQSQLYEKTIGDLKVSLDDADKILSLSQKSLENANNSIELGLKQIKYSQRKQFWRNFGFVGGGIGLGLIGGILLAN